MTTPHPLARPEGWPRTPNPGVNRLKTSGSTAVSNLVPSCAGSETTPAGRSRTVILQTKEATEVPTTPPYTRLVLTCRPSEGFCIGDHRYMVEQTNSPNLVVVRFGADHVFRLSQTRWTTCRLAGSCSSRCAPKPPSPAS
jgi:hypothetical protein